MKYRVTILPRARDDIDRNAQWWAEHHSVEQALLWYDAIYDQLKTLQEFPESHGLSRENDKFEFEIRDKRVGLGSRPRFRAVFTIKDDEVFILTVQAGEQDDLTPDDLRFDPDAE